MLPLKQLRPHGSGLNRPECALAHASGLMLVPDWSGNGGIAAIAPSGRVRRIEAEWPEPLRPNGIALEPGGTVLMAHLGAERGGIYRLHADGGVEPVVTVIAGEPMPPANFPLLDGQGRLWITVSTRRIPRAADYRRDAASGFIALHAGGETRIVADGLGYTNECALSADGSRLYVNETFARRTTAFAVAPDGSLSAPETVARYGPAIFPDGLALDAEGGIWITSIVSNRVIRIAPDGRSETVIEDAEPLHLADVEAAFRSGQMGRAHLDRIRSERLPSISNLAFGGPDLRIAYLGCLLGETLFAFDAPVAGQPPAHWTADLGPLAAFLED